jgi:hypothetical protein
VPVSQYKVMLSRTLSRERLPEGFPRVEWLAGESIVRERRQDQVKCVLRTSPVGRRICERTHDLQELDDRADSRPTDFRIRMNRLVTSFGTHGRRPTGSREKT